MKNDWRDLYAANRAAIARGLGSPPAAPESPAQGPEAAAGGRRRRLRETLTRPVSAQPGGTGEWTQASFRGAGGARPYFVYTPPSYDPSRPAPLVVLLHGCTQDAASIASGTRAHEVADQRGIIVAYPQQTPEHNHTRCWNWFLRPHQARGMGEPAEIAGIAREVITSGRWRIDPLRVFVAGMSAGAAMATILGLTYPDVFAAVGLHSGLPYGTADSQKAALSAMRGGDSDSRRLARHALEAMGPLARPQRVVSFHGTTDQIVAPSNGDELVKQWLAVNRLASKDAWRGDFAHPTQVEKGRAPNGHAYSTARWRDGRGRVVQEYWKVAELGHAWSGGAQGGSYTDPRGPSASRAMVDFFLDEHRTRT